MKVDHEIVAWAAGDTAALLRSSDLGGLAPVRVVEDETDFFAQLPPRRNPRLYLVDLNAILGASPGLLAMLASRPAAYPPIVVFGEDGVRLRAVACDPNSRILVTKDNALELLTTAARYWVTANYPMEIA